MATQPLMSIADAAAALGFLTRNGHPARRTLYQHIEAHGPQINGITFAVQINGRYHCLPDAIERIKRGEHGEESQAA